MMNITFTRKDKKLDLEIVDKLIQISESKKEEIEERIKYLKDFKNNVSNISKLKQEYDEILDKLVRTISKESGSDFDKLLKEIKWR